MTDTARALDVDWKALRIELADAWHTWDDRFIAISVLPSWDQRKASADKETRRLNRAVNTFADAAGLRANVVRELMAALKRVGYDYSEAVRAIQRLADA